jgi:type II secretory pathway component GspD/PulD (secretin)
MIRWTLTLTVLLAMEPRFLSAQAKIPLPQTTLLDIQPGEREAPEAGKVVLYKPKHISAVEAAELVRGLMGQSATVLAEPTGNSLLIKASGSQLKEIQTVLISLDQPPKMIAFEVVFADLPSKADDAAPAKDQPASEEAWLARLKSQADNAKGNIGKLRLTATENQKAMVQFGEQTPVVAGVQQAFGGRGGAPERSPVIRQTQTGTIVQCIARVLEDNTIIAELEIERSRLAPESGTLLEESDDRGSLRTPGQLTTTCKTTVKLKPGKPRVISGLKSQIGNNSTFSLIVISAELITPEQ